MAVTISMIASVSRNGVIGRQGARPWRNPLELQRLDQLTRKRPVVIGRRSFNMLGFVPKERWYFVLTRDQDFLELGYYRDYAGYGYWFYDDFERAFASAEALASSRDCPEIFVAGGADVFRQSMPRISRFYRTLMDLDVEGDAYLPELDLTGWAQILHQRHDRGDTDVSAHDYTIFERPK